MGYGSRSHAATCSMRAQHPSAPKRNRISTSASGCRATKLNRCTPAGSVPCGQLLDRRLHELHARRTLYRQPRQRRPAGELDAELLIQQHPARARGHLDRFLQPLLQVDPPQQEVVSITSVGHFERVGVPAEVGLRHLDVYLLDQSDSCGMTESSLGGVHLDAVEGHVVGNHCITGSAEMVGAPPLDHGVHRFLAFRGDR